jgi:hypothetical protein
VQMISPGLMVQNDKSMMQLCDMCRHHINNNGCYCWSWSLPFSMECTKDTYPHLSVSIKCSFVFSCSLVSLWTCLKPYTCLLCLGPALHLPHPCNPLTNFAGVSECDAPSLPFCWMRFLLWPLLLYLQVGVHSQNRNPKKKKKKTNSEKQKKLLLFQESPP